MTGHWEVHIISAYPSINGNKMFKPLFVIVALAHRISAQRPESCFEFGLYKKLLLFS